MRNLTKSEMQVVRAAITTCYDNEGPYTVLHELIVNESDTSFTAQDIFNRTDLSLSAIELIINAVVDFGVFQVNGDVVFSIPCEALMAIEQGLILN